MRNKIQASKLKNGYTLLFSVITAALVLGVGVFILGVSKKQYALSVTARESMYALYAADSAIECTVAAYVNNALSTTSANAVIDCDGRTASQPFTSNSTPDSALWSGPIIQAVGIPLLFKGTQSAFTPGGQCSLIDVKYGPNRSGEQVLRIEARGYNQCTATGPTVSSRTVERALRLTKRGI